jgi:hypothetical protein
MGLDVYVPLEEEPINTIFLHSEHHIREFLGRELEPDDTQTLAIRLSEYLMRKENESMTKFNATHIEQNMRITTLQIIRVSNCKKGLPRRCFEWVSKGGFGGHPPFT